MYLCVDVFQRPPGIYNIDTFAFHPETLSYSRHVSSARVSVPADHHQRSSANSPPRALRESLPQRKPLHGGFRVRINYVCVDHCGTQISVTQHFLGQPNVFGLAVELGGKGMPEHMGMDIFDDPRFFGTSFDHSAECSIVDSLPLESREQHVTHPQR